MRLSAAWRLNVALVGGLTCGAFPGSLASAACPEALCDCLGEARRFSVVSARNVALRTGKICYYMDGCSLIDVATDAICSSTVRMTGSDPSDNTGVYAVDVAAVATSGRAAQFRKSAEQSPPSVGVLATGGGLASGPVEATLVDTTGMHPLIAACRQAMDDVRTASATLAGLAPTHSLDVVDLSGANELEIVAGPGVNVINVSRFTLQSLRSLGYVYAPTVYVTLAPETQAVVINTPRLKIARGSQVLSFGSEGRVIFNVIGSGPAVYVGADTDFQAAILSPDRPTVILPSTYGSPQNVFARSLTMSGNFAFNAFAACP